MAGESGEERASFHALKGQRVFTCGHSFHIFISPILDEMARAAGIANHEVAGLSGIGGSRVIDHWNQHRGWEALTGGKVDVLTLSPIWLPDEGIERYAKLALEHNPNARITVQEFWLPNDRYEPDYPTDQWRSHPKVDHNAANIAELRKQHEPYFQGMDDHVRELNRRLGKDALFIVPVGQAVLALREKIVAGQVPGLKTQSQLFTDSWGHPGVVIQALDAYCHFAVIYQTSPVGLPVPDVMAKTKVPDWDEKLNRLLQELAWDAVIHHPLSGVLLKK